MAGSIKHSIFKRPRRRIIFAKALDPSVTMLITLDENQSGSKTEKALLASDIAKNPTPC